MNLTSSLELDLGWSALCVPRSPQLRPCSIPEGLLEEVEEFTPECLVVGKVLKEGVDGLGALGIC